MITALYRIMLLITIVFTAAWMSAGLLSVIGPDPFLVILVLSAITGIIYFVKENT